MATGYVSHFLRGHPLRATAILFLLVVVTFGRLRRLPSSTIPVDVGHRRLASEQEPRRLAKANIFDITTCEEVCRRCSKIYKKRQGLGQCAKNGGARCDKKFDRCKQTLKQELPDGEECLEGWCDLTGDDEDEIEFIFDVELEVTYVNVTFCLEESKCDSLEVSPLEITELRTKIEDRVLKQLQGSLKKSGSIYEYQSLVLSAIDQRRRLGGGNNKKSKGSGGGSGRCRPASKCNNRRRRKLAIHLALDEDFDFHANAEEDGPILLQTTMTEPKFDAASAVQQNDIDDQRFSTREVHKKRRMRKKYQYRHNTCVRVPEECDLLCEKLNPDRDRYKNDRDDKRQRSRYRNCVRKYGCPPVHDEDEDDRIGKKEKNDPWKGNHKPTRCKLEAGRARKDGGFADKKFKEAVKKELEDDGVVGFKKLNELNQSAFFFDACKPQTDNCTSPISNKCCHFPGCTCLKVSSSLCNVGTNGVKCHLYRNGLDDGQSPNLCCEKKISSCAEVCESKHKTSTN